ncbi:unnamed protein product [Rhizophagus irregularis]|nr:unnamed protein product [Rhizophagus irregularis]
MSLFSSIKIIKIKLKFKKKSLRNTEKDLLELLSNKKYDFSSFNNIELTGRGSFGTVFRANRKNKNFALKTFNNNKMTLVVKELKIHKLVNHHENILRFCGITEINADTVYQINKYCLVLEYADSGTLNKYLSNHFNELNWYDKLSLALQLAKALQHLHDKDIIHCDLHANNILIHKKTIKLADFVNGEREGIIEGTPVEYSNLFKDCWKFEPNERPNIQKVVSSLDKLIKDFSY